MCWEPCKVLGAVVDKKSTAPPLWNLPWIKGTRWMHTRKPVNTSPLSLTTEGLAQSPGAGCWTLPPRNLNLAQNSLAVLLPRTLLVLQSCPGSLRYWVFLQTAIYWLPIMYKHWTMHIPYIISTYIIWKFFKDERLMFLGRDTWRIPRG